MANVDYQKSVSIWGWIVFLCLFFSRGNIKNVSVILISVKESAFILLQTVPSHVNVDNIIKELEEVSEKLLSIVDMQLSLFHRTTLGN